MNRDLMKDYLLSAFPNPERKGCPDEETLKALAERRLPLDDPAMLHVASCSECYAEYRNYRLDMEELADDPPVTSDLPKQTRVRRFRALPLAIAASIVVICGIGYVANRAFERSSALVGLHSHAQLASSIPVRAQVDLFNATTLRGDDAESNPLQEVHLPAAVVRLDVILPRFSQSGAYGILVSKDRAGQQLVAEGHGIAVDSQGKLGLAVTLDLRRAKPGMYFLATVRGSDNGTYYYPLEVR